MKDRGQSLVEVALAIPILLILFLGVFEVGLAIQRQMRVTTTAREITRFATKPPNSRIEGNRTILEFSNVVTHARVTGSDMKDIRIEVVVVDVFTGFPCDPALRGTDDWCDCGSVTVDNSFQPPMVVAFKYTTPMFAGELNEMEEGRITAQNNLTTECAAMISDAGHTPVRITDVVARIEVDYDQLLGFPLFGLVDPYTLSSQTRMRIPGYRTFE